MKSGSDILICSVNWLGDGIMSLPAMQALKRGRPGCRIAVLTKSKLADLWRMTPVVDETIPYVPRFGGTFRAIAEVRRKGYPSAYVFPNSFRSALVPWVAGIPERTGTRGRWRAWMLTRVVRRSAVPGAVHQSREYAAILGLPDDVDLPAPDVAVGDSFARSVRERFGVSSCGGWVGLIPGAARGPSKRWPAGHFAQVGRALTGAAGRRVLVLGTENESTLCSQMAAEIGESALSLAGRTNLAEFAGLLKSCSVVVTNDSGGMHLAAAVGTPVVAVFGLTDPARTGPMGSGHRVIARTGMAVSRDIDRDSVEARSCLESIRPGEVIAAAEAILKECA